MKENIEFTPELMAYIKLIYGDKADLLSGKTLKNLYLTWKLNPQFFKNASTLKNTNNIRYLVAAKPSLRTMVPKPISMPLLPTRELLIALDDLSHISSFNEAFNIAHLNGLKQFIWKKTKANPSGLFAVTFASNKPALEPVTPAKQIVNKPEQSLTQFLSPVLVSLSNYQDNIELPNLRNLVKGSTLGKGLPTITNENLVASKLSGKIGQSLNKTRTNSVLATINRAAMKNTVQGGDFGIHNGLLRLFNYFGDAWDSRKSEAKPLTLSLGHTTRFQQGGQMNSRDWEMQKLFILFLILDAAKQGIEIKSELDLLKYAQSLGKEGLKAKQLEFVLVMQSGVMARLGAKLDYIKKLKGVCPEGYELKFFKQGGKFCKACEKIQKGNKLTNEVDKFKASRIKKNACGSKLKKKKK